MQSSMRVTITLPAELGRAVERARRARHLSRSAIIAEAVRKQLAAEAEEARERSWIEGYRRIPETESEAAFSAVASSMLEPTDWERSE